MNLRLLTFFFLSTISFAQDSNRGIVFYGAYESINQGPQNGPQRLCCLIFNNKESSYVTKKDSLDRVANTEQKTLYTNGESGGIIQSGGLPTCKNGYQVYTSLEKDSVWSSFQRGEFVFVKEKKVIIDWKLSDETKKIGRFECKKASAFFRGRQYIAWYAPEIPLPFGPWKLQGLPGLILEAYIPSKEIYFYMRKIEYPTENKFPLQQVIKDKDNKWLTYTEYLKKADELLIATYEKMVLLGFGKGAIKEKLNASSSFKEISE